MEKFIFLNLFKFEYLFMYEVMCIECFKKIKEILYNNLK